MICSDQNDGSVYNQNIPNNYNPNNAIYNNPSNNQPYGNNPSYYNQMGQNANGYLGANVGCSSSPCLYGGVCLFVKFDLFMKQSF